MSDSRLTYHEPPEFAVTEGMRKKGYIITGVYSGQDEIGILTPQEPVQEQFLWFKWYSRRNALIVGNLILDGDPELPNVGRHGRRIERAKRYESWVLKVYGREYVDELAKAIDEISKPYNVNVYATLADEHPHKSCVSSEPPFRIIS